MLSPNKTSLSKYPDKVQVIFQKGKRCIPSRTYAVSKQSPSYFQGPNTLLADGYLFHQVPTPDHTFSQKKYYSIDGTHYNNFKIDFQNQITTNFQTFHRKKGRLSQFMDRNYWLKQIMPIMGNERSTQSRQVSNRQINVKIKSLKNKSQKTTLLQYRKMDHNYLKGIPNFTSQKSKLTSKIDQVRKKRIIFSPQKKNNFIKASDLQLTNQSRIDMAIKQWNSTKSTFYKTTPFFNPKGTLELSQNIQILPN